nr:MAG TPA: hypothetical protein [Caudoviricetes sp.]
MGVIATDKRCITAIAIYLLLYWNNSFRAVDIYIFS